MQGEIPRRPLGATGVEVSALALGGAHLGGLEEGLAVRLVQEAIDAGLTFLDNAWEYAGGRSEELMGKALRGRRDRAFLMTKACSHGRSRAVALRQLDESLRRLGTGHVDLWQLHEVVYPTDPGRHFARDGAIEALEEARRAGKVRFVGFTGHKDPAIHLDMLSRGYRFDTCQLPLNCFDATFRSFERAVLPELARQGIAALGMKPLCGSGAPVKQGVVTAEEALRYAMSLPVATTVTGIDSLEVLRQALAIARGFRPLSEGEREALRRRCAPHAADGRFELFKVTMGYDADEGRARHGFPSMREAPW